MKKNSEYVLWLFTYGFIKQFFAPFWTFVLKTVCYRNFMSKKYDDHNFLPSSVWKFNMIKTETRILLDDVKL